MVSPNTNEHTVITVSVITVLIRHAAGHLADGAAQLQPAQRAVAHGEAALEHLGRDGSAGSAARNHRAGRRSIEHTFLPWLTSHYTAERTRGLQVAGSQVSSSAVPRLSVPGSAALRFLVLRLSVLRLSVPWFRGSIVPRFRGSPVSVVPRFRSSAVPRFCGSRFSVLGSRFLVPGLTAPAPRGIVPAEQSTYC